jgi:Ca2+-binding EF-hand superfamily protein
MKKITIASITTLLAAASFVPAVAFAHGGEGGKKFARFDRDGNGVVSRDEMRTTALEHFTKLDTNKDGKLTLAEIEAGAQNRAAERLARDDKNHDGKLSRAEVPNMPDQVFARLDKNSDGVLSAEELQGNPERAEKHAQKWLERADTDHDGAISRDEAIAAMDRKFGRLDTNNDGVVTAEEAKAAHHGRGKHGHEGQNTPNQ